jgi:DNA-binding Xre family transcriptional regulator
MTVINKIRQFLDERGVTPYRFQKAVGIATGTAYALYNNPDQLPSSTVLSKICDTYKVQPGELLEWIEGVSGNHAESGTISDTPAE